MTIRAPVIESGSFWQVMLKKQKGMSWVKAFVSNDKKCLRRLRIHALVCSHTHTHEYTHARTWFRSTTSSCTSASRSACSLPASWAWGLSGAADTALRAASACCIRVITSLWTDQPASRVTENPGHRKENHSRRVYTTRVRYFALTRLVPPLYRQKYSSNCLLFGATHCRRVVADMVG